MTDQGGTAKFRERFTGGGAVWPERLYGSLKAVDPVTGEIKATAKLTYPNFAGALATAGDLVFLGHMDGTFAAYDAKTLQTVRRGAGGRTSADQHPSEFAGAQEHVNGLDAVRVQLIGSGGSLQSPCLSGAKGGSRGTRRARDGSARADARQARAGLRDAVPLPSVVGGRWWRLLADPLIYPRHDSCEHVHLTAQAVHFLAQAVAPLHRPGLSPMKGVSSSRPERADCRQRAGRGRCEPTAAGCHESYATARCVPLSHAACRSCTAARRAAMTSSRCRRVALCPWPRRQRHPAGCSADGPQAVSPLTAAEDASRHRDASAQRASPQWHQGPVRLADA